MKPSADQIDYLNVGLMIVSCLVAFVIPFELFLFSYAVLGPLHYLTEISWLHDRGYFTVSPRVGCGRAKSAHAGRYWLALVGLTLAVMLYGVVAEKALHLKATPVWEIGAFYLVFVSAALFIFARSVVTAAVVIVLTGIGLVLFSGSPYYGLIAFLLITIVHVFVFTAAFILLGALRSKRRSGVLSLAVFCSCAASFFVVVPDAFGPGAGGFVRTSYESFTTLNAQLIKLFHLGAGSTLSEVYESNAGLIVMRLIAFAYTYHYLNWFSKTSVIKWHEIPRSRTAVILVLWAASLAIYARSYELGFVVLYFLSVLHVMLEFPLNHQTFIGIGKELRALGGAARSVAEEG